jgi:hypothetical protein
VVLEKHNPRQVFLFFVKNHTETGSLTGKITHICSFRESAGAAQTKFLFSKSRENFEGGDFLMHHDWHGA